MIKAEELAEHPRNSNKQSRSTFDELRKSIHDNGFDESLIVVPRDDGQPGWWVVSGNHRMRAGIAEGLTEFPCVVREDWDDVQQQIELVRRNYVRGAIDKDAFTIAVDTLAMESSLAVEEISKMMGFQDMDAFAKLYHEEEEDMDEVVQSIQNASRTTPAAVQMIDNLGLVLSAIFEQYGDTVPSSFIIFPAGGKKHCFIAANPTIVKNIQDIAEYALANHTDINLVLGGILTIGKHHSHMTNPNATKEDLLESGDLEEGPDEFSKVEIS